MKRRDFLIMGSATALSPYIQAQTAPPLSKSFKPVKETIFAVQSHMFPKGGRLPSARAMGTIRFTEETLFHPTYDKDIRAFVIEGARELMRREKGFLSYTDAQKEKALRTYEQTDYGRSWLSRIMVLTMEAIFSDPIYGSNIKEAGWRSVQSFGGEPRPQTRYIEL
jgi:hypothetical protein